MYYNNGQEDELGFDAFIAPDDFDRHAQPVDIYEVFKYWYSLNNQARYIYYYSDGNYPLTLTPTADEYYKYGYTQGGSDIVVDVALNAAPVTIFGETLTTKRWVIVYRVSNAKFGIIFAINNALWVYFGTSINDFQSGGNLSLKYIHFANLNSLTQSLHRMLYPWSGNNLTGRLIIPETVSDLGEDTVYYSTSLLNKFTLPNTKNVVIVWAQYIETFKTFSSEILFGASTYLTSFNSSDQNKYTNLSIISVSPQNTAYASFNNCDIIYNKALTEIVWIAPKTVRGLHIPDELPQSQIDLLGTKLSTNIMANHQLYIGSQITDLTNLYLSNKSFVTIEVGAGNTAFSVQNGLLISATGQLIKAGTYNTGDLIIPCTVTEILANSFLRCNGYTGDLIIPNNVTSIVANSFNGLSGLTGDLIIGNGVTSIVANAFSALTNLTGNLIIPSSVTSIASGVFNGLTNMTSLTLPVGFDTAIYNIFSFANFSAASLNTSILNLASGTVGAPKYFIISKTSLDALNVAYPNAVSDAAARYINVVFSIIQDSSLKLWLDAGNTTSYPGTGTVWSDLSGNGNNGTLVNGVAYSTANGGVMSFDGVNDYVSLPVVQNVKSISFWINVNDVTTPDYMIGTSDNGGIRYNGSSWLHYYGGSTAGFISVNWTKINNMVNFCAIDKGLGYWDYYINGGLIGTGFCLVDNKTFSINRIGIGSAEINNFWFKGPMNDIAIYDRALTSAEVLHNFNVTRFKYNI